MSIDKERLKVFLNGWYQGWPIDHVGDEEEKALSALLALLDRQPTEDKALDMMHDIEWFMSNCLHHSGLSEFSKCEDCFDFGRCQLKKEAFCNLLNIAATK